MKLILDDNDLARLGAATIADLIRLPAQKALVHLPPSVAEEDTGHFDYKGLVDLDLEQVKELMLGLKKTIIDGLRVVAEHGPVVDYTVLLEWDENTAKLKAATTKRVRTITGKHDVYLLKYHATAWDESDNETAWSYFVTPKTHQSLRAFFDL